MADRQTTGGYPNLATVISADIGLAGQLAPGDRIQFEVCTLQTGDGGADQTGAGADGRRAGRRRMSDLARQLAEAFGAGRIGRDVPLAPLTTFRVGGPADWFFETRTSDEIVTALRLAHAAGVPVTLLGGGSNVLVSDAGVRGLVIRPRGGAIASARPVAGCAPMRR